MDLQYQSKQQIIHTNAPAPIWDFFIVTESDIMSRISREVLRIYLELLTGGSVDISKYIDF